MLFFRSYLLKKGEKQMKELMKQETRKKNKVLLIVYSIVLLVGLGMIIPRLLEQSKKAEELVDIIEEFYEDDEFDSDEHESLVGKKVSVEVEYVLERYFEDGSRKGYYVFDDEIGYCYGINVDSKYYKVMEEMLEQTNKWLYEDDELPEPITIVGTIRELDNLERYEFKETAQDSEYLFSGSDYKDYTLIYTIDTNNTKSPLLMLFAFGAMFAYVGFWGLVYGLVVQFTGFKYRKIKKYIEKNGLNEADVEADFRASKRIKHVFIGTKYTYNMDGTCWKMFRNDDIVWAYYHRITGRYSVSRVEAYHYNKKCTYINASKAVSEAVLQYYGQVFPHIVLGYSIDLRTTYYADFNKFLTYRYIPAQQRINPQQMQNNVAPVQPQQPNAATGSQDSFSANIMKKQMAGVYTEPGEYTVSFTGLKDGPSKIVTIKYIREMFGLGLKEAKDLADAHGVIAKNISLNAATEIKNVLEVAGEIVEITQNVAQSVNTTVAQNMNTSTQSVNTTTQSTGDAEFDEIIRNVAAGVYNGAGTYSVRFVYIGDEKVKTIKYVSAILGIGVSEAKDIVDSQGNIAKNISKESAEAIKKVLETLDNVVTVSSYSI